MNVKMGLYCLSWKIYDDACKWTHWFMSYKIMLPNLVNPQIVFFPFFELLSQLIFQRLHPSFYWLGNFSDSLFFRVTNSENNFFITFVELPSQRFFIASFSCKETSDEFFLSFENLENFTSSIRLIK